MKDEDVTEIKSELNKINYKLDIILNKLNNIPSKNNNDLDSVSHILAREVFYNIGKEDNE